MEKVKKINCVYLYKNKKLNNPYILLLDKTANGYEARQVTLSGALVNKKMLVPLNAVLYPIDAKVILTIELPRRVRDHIKYKSLITEALETKAIYQEIKHKDKSQAEECRQQMVRLAMASFELQNSIEGRRYNFRDFAKTMKFKRFATFYSWVIKHFNQQYNKTHYKQIKDCADSTLVKVIRNYNERIYCFIGQNKELDLIIKRHLNAYIAEAGKRGLKIYD